MTIQNNTFAFILKCIIGGSMQFSVSIISIPIYLLTYLAITTCYRSWPQLICGAIHHELLQLGGYPAFLDSHQPVLSNAGRPSLFATNWLWFEDFTNWVEAIHTSDMTQPSKTLYFNTLHYVDVIVYIVQLLVPSYALFSSVAERSINLRKDFPLEDA